MRIGAAIGFAEMMMADEFLRMTGENDDERYELIEGEICERDLNGYAHDLVKNNLKELFDRAMRDRLFTCWLEHSFRLGDLSVVTPEWRELSAEDVEFPPFFPVLRSRSPLFSKAFESHAKTKNIDRAADQRRSTRIRTIQRLCFQQRLSALIGGRLGLFAFNR
jgi:hypothetical protein